MQIVKGSNPLKTILDKEAGKTVGKFTCNQTKFYDDKLQMHEGHDACFKALRDAGCEIIVAEFILLEIFHYEAPVQDKDFKDDEKTILEFCEGRPGFDADYLIYGAKDLSKMKDSNLRTLVEQRIKDEDYVARLGIPSSKVEYFVKGCILGTMRHQNGCSGYMVVRSLKSGSEHFGIAHYARKYCDIEFLTIDTVPYENEKAVMSSTMLGVEHTEPCYLKFCKEFYKNTSYAKLSKLAETGGATLEDFKIIDDPELIPGGKYMTCRYVLGYAYDVVLSRYI